MNTKSMLREIASRRREGDSAYFQKVMKNGYSRSHISNVLAGRRNNDQIVSTIYRAVSRRKVTA
jgi:hypothetical protein